MKAESANMEVSADAVESNVNPNSLVSISTQKLNEYFELVKLKQQHPEFESDINEQLLSFTTDSLSVLNYGSDFTISNIQQTGNRKIISDSVEVFTLKYTVTTDSKIFQDSVLTRITSRADYLDPEEAVTIKKVRFSKF
nr:hypothetical protein [uncultured Psychroserpens sp.]